MRRLAIPFALAFVAGCGEGAFVPPTHVAQPKFSASDATVKANKMLSELEALPPSQRKDYLMAHSSELHAFADTNDKTLSDRFRKEMGGK